MSLEEKEPFNKMSLQGIKQHLACTLRLKSVSSGSYLKRRIRNVSFLVFTVLGSGCSLNNAVAVTEASPQKLKGSGSDVVQKSNLSESSQEKQAPERLLHLNSQQMFEVMAAEMLFKRKQIQGAFNTIYPLAKELKHPELAKRAFEIGMHTFNLQYIDQSVQLWKDVAPQNSDAWRASFVMSLRKGEVEPAIVEWEQYQRLSEANLQSDFISSAGSVASATDEANGIKFFQLLVEKYPEEWSSYYALGMVCAAYSNASIGIPVLEKAKELMLEQDAGDSLSLVYNLLSKLYLSVKPATEGIDALTPYVKKNPKDLLVQERLARIEVQARRYQAAQKRYQYIVDQEPEAYSSRFSLSLLQMEQDDYAGAEENLTIIARQKGYESIAYYYLGVLYQDQNNYEKAVDHFKKVVSETYKADATLHMAEILYKQGKKDAADDMLDRVDTSNSQNKVKQLRAKAIFANNDGEVRKAIGYYNEALALQPNSASMLKAVSQLHYNIKEYVNYEAALLKALNINDQDSEALNALGYFYLEQNSNLDVAFSLISNALKLEPESFFILDSMGWYYYKVGEYERALDYLTQSFAKVEDEEVLLHLISAYWANGQEGKAREMWNLYRTKFSNSERLQNIINRLESIDKQGLR